MFDLLNPYLLLLLLITPFFFWGKKRRLISQMLRALAFVLLIFALANPVLYISSRGGKLIYLLDNSRSTGLTLNLSDLPSAKGVEEYALFFGDEHFTDLGKALQDASALIPEGGGKIVLLSDGADTEGGMESGIEACKKKDIKVDAIPVSPPWKDSSVSLYAPTTVIKNQAFPLHVRLRTQGLNNTDFALRLDGKEILHEALNLEEGDNFFTYYVSFEEGGIHAVEAELLKGDLFLENNLSRLYVQVLERKGILVVSNQPNAEEFCRLLEVQGFPFDLIVPQDFPEEPQQLAAYEGVCLLDVSPNELSEGKIKALSSFVRDFGGGLLAIGGGHSFTLGGYFRSELEELLPVLSAPQLEKEIPEMALIFVIDNSSSMWKLSQGIQKLDLAEEVAIHASAPLREFDQVGVLFFADQPQWALSLGAGRNFSQIKERISMRGPGGGTNAYLALQEAYRSLEGSQAPLKHVILISDGKSSEGDFATIVSEGRKNGVYTTAIAVGADADLDFMRQISQLGEGKFAQVTAGEEIPSVIFPPSAEQQGKKVEEGELLAEFNPSMTVLKPVKIPPLQGYLKTRLKERAIALYEFLPQREPLLALWTQGQGRVAAWTSDFAGPWTGELSGWEGFSDFWASVLGWVAPPYKPLAFYPELKGKSLYFRAFSPDPEPLILTIEGPEGKVAHAQVRKTGPEEFEEKIALWGRGIYLLNAFQGEKKYTQAFWFPDEETEELGLDLDNLKAISSRTGGKIYPGISEEILTDMPSGEKEIFLREWLLLLTMAIYLAEVFISTRLRLSKKS
jgi:uncharacterized membrane protein